MFSLRLVCTLVIGFLAAYVPAGAVSIDFTGTGLNTDIVLPDGPGTQNLGVSSFTVLGGSANVRSERTTCAGPGCVGSAELSQRPDSGLGIWGGRENDEIDSGRFLFPYETLWFETSGGADWTLNAFDLTLLFDNEFWRFDERALANIWLDGAIVDTITATGLASGGNGGLWSFAGAVVFDRIQFNAPFDFGLSDFALRGLDVTANGTGGTATVPEPASILLLGTGLLGAAGLQRRRERRRRDTDKSVPSA